MRILFVQDALPSQSRSLLLTRHAVADEEAIRAEIGGRSQKKSGVKRGFQGGLGLPAACGQLWRMMCLTGRRFFVARNKDLRTS